MQATFAPGSAVGAASLLALTLAACASAPQQVAIPPALEAGPGEALVMTVPAKGVQIYECRAGKDAAAAPEWVFVAPEAELFDARGAAIGRHGAGPYWQAADGSRIVGKVKARADAPAAGTIPWLLLAASSTGPQGTFSKVTSVQRVHTVGGAAPAAGCTRDAVGRSARIGYTADYRLFAPR